MFGNAITMNQTEPTIETVLAHFRPKALASAEVGKNAIRKTLVTAIFDTPGITFTGLHNIVTESKGCPGSNYGGTLQKHLRILENGRQIKSTKVGKCTYHFPRGFKPEWIEQVIVNSGENYMAIGKYVSDHPGESLAHIAQALDISRSVVSYQMKNLIKDKVIRLEVKGKEKLAYLV
jgi:predicted transcriptional regulator